LKENARDTVADGRELPVYVMKILVTGAAGFMCSHLVNALLADGHEVYGVDDLSGGFMENVNPASRFLQLDLRNFEAVRTAVQLIQPELVYHLAADATEGRSQFTPVSAVERNYLAHMNLLTALIDRTRFRKIVVASSMSVYGAQSPPFTEDLEPAPEDIYAISKAAMEKATKLLADVHGFRYAILRPHNVYGPHQNFRDPYRNVVAIFINCLLNNRPFFLYGDGEQTRSFSYIDDINPIIVRIGYDAACDGQVYNVGPGPECMTTLNELASIVLEEFFGGAAPDHLAPKYLPARPREVKHAYASSERIERELGFKNTTTVRDGVAKTIAWAKTIGPQPFIYLSRLEIENDLVPATWKEKLY
jgi:UDP-glucose 4-epimerase